MARYHGKNLRILISPSGSTTAVVLTGGYGFTIDAPTDRADVTAGGDANKRYVTGLRDYTGSLSARWDDTSDQLYDAGSSADGCKLYLYPDFTNAPTKYFAGPAWVDFSMSVTNDDGINVSANWAANGDWVQF